MSVRGFAAPRHALCQRFKLDARVGVRAATIDDMLMRHVLRAVDALVRKRLAPLLARVVVARRTTAGLGSPLGAACGIMSMHRISSFQDEQNARDRHDHARSVG